jgi:hypothetical protein
LQPEHAAILVMQVPAALEAKAKGGCPAADYQEKAEGWAEFTLRNLCGKADDAVLGTYLVEFNSGRILEGSESGSTVDSATLRTARARVCSMSVRGVLPSLLPHASSRTRRRAGAGRNVASAARKR